MATRVVEGKKPYTGGKAISIDENKVISLNLRDENNLIIYDEGDDEIYVDLQLPDGIEPTDAFPVGVTTGRVLVADGWDKAGTIISAKTTSGDEIKILYADDGTLRLDNGTGTFKQVYFKADVDAIVQAIWDYIYANCNTKTFYTGTYDVNLAQAVYDWISQGNFGIVYFNPVSGIKRDVIFPPTTTETGTISSWSYTDVRQATGGMFYEDLITLEFGVSDGVATTGINSNGTVVNNDGRIILINSVAPSNPLEGTTWYDTVNGVLKVYDGSSWKEVGGSDIEYKTQAEYNALLPGALTDNKHYFIYTSSSSGRLPAEYQKVEWIKPSGMGPYIDSGLNPSSTLRFEMEITPDTSYTSTNAILGNDWSAQAIFFMFYNGIYRLHNGGTVADGPSATNSLTKITVDNSEYTINGTPYACVSGNNYGPSSAIYIYGSNSPYYPQDTYGGVYQLHSMQIKDNGTLVRDFVPCYRKLDSVIGLYDLVNDVFYTNGGAGTFTKGNDVN